MARQIKLHGVIPAHLMPFDDDLAVHEESLRRHIRELVAIEGVEGLTTNGHAAEVAALTLEEQHRSLRIAVEEVAGRVPVICGVYADATARACEIAAMAEGAGADALLIFPSAVGRMGGHLRPEMAFEHHRMIADRTSLPMIVFEHPVSTGQHLGPDLLQRICEQIENVVAVKEWSNDITRYERTYRALKQLDKPVSVLTSFSTSLLASLAIGADGILSGHGSIVARHHVDMFAAIQRGDLEAAREVSARLFPLVQACYGEPFLDMHNRMKTMNALLGKFDNAHVRAPLMRLCPEEEAELARVLRDHSHAGL